MLPAAVLVAEALLLMLDRDIHHVAVMRGGRIVGMVSDKQLLRRQAGGPLLLMERIKSLDRLEALLSANREWREAPMAVRSTGDGDGDGAARTGPELERIAVEHQRDLDALAAAPEGRSDRALLSPDLHPGLRRHGLVGREISAARQGRQHGSAAAGGGAGGAPFLGFIAAVAFATILAVVAGLTLAGAAALSHDLWVNVVRRRPCARGASSCEWRAVDRRCWA